MGVNKTADDVETLGIPVGSAPLNSTAVTQAIGKPLEHWIIRLP